MQFSQSLIALVASASLVAAAPSFKRQASQCVSEYGCPFEIMVAGCPSAQLDDGQVRVSNSSISEIADGQTRCDLTGSTPSSFTLANGQVTDSAGRVCEISNQNQFQCSATPDSGATTTGFSVCNGLLAFNSNSSFIACLATGALPGYNIYTADVDRSTVTNCMPVELDVPACPVASTSCVASTVTLPAQTVENTVTAPAQTVVDTVTATLPAQTIVNTVTAPAQTVVNTVTAPAQTIVNTVTAPAQTVVDTVTAPAQTVVNTVTITDTTTQVVPTTITVVQTEKETVTKTPVAATTTSAAQETCTNIVQSLGSSSFPNTISVVNENTDVSGSSYFAYIGSGNSTIFTFNSQSSSGQCSINFLFPTNAEIVAQSGTTSYDISSSSIAVTLYELTSVSQVTDTYATKPARGQAYSLTLTPGTDSTFATFACPSGQTSYELVATDSNTLSFFEDYNPPPLGLTVGKCA